MSFFHTSRGSSYSSSMPIAVRVVDVDAVRHAEVEAQVEHDAPRLLEGELPQRHPDHLSSARSWRLIRPPP